MNTDPNISLKDRRAGMVLDNLTFRKRLIALGIYPSVVIEKLKQITDIASRETALAEWEYSQNITRNSPLLNAMAPEFGFNDEQLDELFEYTSMNYFAENAL